jgi:hypothetical protein
MFSCEKCGKHYTEKRSLLRHMKIHLKDPNIALIGLTIPFEYKKKDLPCADIIAFFTSFTDVQDIA